MSEPDEYDEMMRKLADNQKTALKQAQLRAYSMGISPHNAPRIDGEAIDPMRQRQNADQAAMREKDRSMEP